MQWHQLDHMQTICTLLQTDNHTNTSALNFYRPDALPDTQPTESKNWRQLWSGLHQNHVGAWTKCILVYLAVDTQHNGAVIKIYWLTFPTSAHMGQFMWMTIMVSQQMKIQSLVGNTTCKHQCMLAKHHAVYTRYFTHKNRYCLLLFG